MLDDARAQELSRIEGLYEKYYPALQTAIVKINVLIFQVKEQNTKFEQGDRWCLNGLSDYYLKSFWNFAQVGFEAAAFAQLFSRLVDDFKPLPLSKNRSSGLRCETLLIFQRELRAHHAKQLDRYESILSLKKSICTIVQKYETIFLQAINQVGLYQQTIANSGVPLCFLRHAFSTYHIACVEPDEEKEEKRTDTRGCGKLVHNGSRNCRSFSIEK